MKKIFTIFVFTIFLMSMVFIVGALKPNVKDIVDSRADREVFIPENAVEISPGVFNLGKAIDVDGRVVEGLMFVHNKKADAKPSWAGGGNGGSKCYEHLAKGAKWKEESRIYLVENGIDTGMIKDSMNEWDGRIAGFKIFGSLDSEIADGDGAIGEYWMDGDNEVLKEDLGSTGTIAYAIVWGIFGGNPSNRELVEWDVVFNTNFSFGNAGPTDEDKLGNVGVMDYQNIATHEFGHTLGMGHAPTSSDCTEETMYPTATSGETKKRTLNSGDITGINALY